MKKLKGLFILSTLSIGILAACGDDEEVTNAPDNAPVEQENGAAVPIPADAPFNFTQFSLDVDYGVNKSLEVSYDNESTGVEAAYESDLSNEKLNGNDAYTKMEPIFKGFTFDINTSNEEVIQQVKEAFNVEEDYKELEIDIRFSDGAEKEYRDVK